MDPTRAKPDFLLLGESGFLGSAIKKALEAAGHTVAVSNVRLQDRIGIERALDESPPALGLICAAGERGRPNISWCDSHPVETVDANITGQLNVATACYERNIHATILGTGMVYTSEGCPPDHRFSEREPPNAPSKSVYVALRRKMEELLAYYNNVLILRVLYPVSSDLDPRGLIGKIARFERVDKVQASVTVLEDLCPLIPTLVKSRATGPLNFVNPGTVVYSDIVEDLAKTAPSGWRLPQMDAEAATKLTCGLDASRLEELSGRKLPQAADTVRRIIAHLTPDDFRALAPGSNL